VTYVSEDPEDALRQMEYVRKRFNIEWHFHQGSIRMSKSRPEHDPMPAGLERDLAQFAENNVVGDPERIVNKLRLYEELGFDQFIAQVDFGQPHEQAMRSLRLFMDEVIPPMRQQPAPARAAVPRAATAARNGRRPAAEVKAELLQHNEREIGTGWRTWEALQWLEHFETRRERGDPSVCHVFDYDAGPTVHSDSSGMIAGGSLALLRDDACPECSRPVIALYRRYGSESLEQMRSHLQEQLRSQGWHSRHP
jgi:hypothetical protein